MHLHRRVVALEEQLELVSRAVHDSVLLLVLPGVELLLPILVWLAPVPGQSRPIKPHVSAHPPSVSHVPLPVNVATVCAAPPTCLPLASVVVWLHCKRQSVVAVPLGTFFSSFEDWCVSDAAPFQRHLRSRLHRLDQRHLHVSCRFL